MEASPESKARRGEIGVEARLSYGGFPRQIFSARNGPTTLSEKEGLLHPLARQFFLGESVPGA
jgi:hypothetical protein